MTRQRARVVSFGAKKITAIKLVRELTRAGLREAKDTVEAGASFEFDLDSRTRSVLAEARADGIQIELEGGAVAHVGGGGVGHSNQQDEEADDF